MQIQSERIKLLSELIILLRKAPLAFQTLLKVELSYTKIPNTYHLGALNLLLATEEPKELAQCSVAGFILYALTMHNVTIVCVADPTDPQSAIETFLKKVFELLEEIDLNNLQSEGSASGFALQIRKLAERIIPSEFARGLVEDLGLPEEKGHGPIKIVFLGLSKAGKTSINKVFFEKASSKELEDLKPTLLRDEHRHSLEITKKRITVVDLGGQSQFIPLHFQDPMIFSKISALVFVLDVQNPARFAEAGQYFSKVADFIAKEGRGPSVTILFHKFDPEIQAALLLSLDKALKSIISVLQPFQPTCFFTSIFDPRSIEQALTNVLFRTLPAEVLEQTLTSDVLLEAFHRIIPIYERVSNDLLLPEENARLVLKELSAAMGGELAKRLTKKWQLFLCKDQPLKVSSNELLVRVTQKDVTRFELRCPLPKERQEAIYCWVTHGLVEGLARVLGLGPVERIRTMAIDNAPSCAFISKYG